MKRSRIFLGVTTVLLAIAGIAAAKSRRVALHTVYWFTRLNAAQTNGLCTRVKVTHCSVEAVGVNCTARVGLHFYQIYTEGSSTKLGNGRIPCFTPVMYQAQ